jgi:glycosyltransferase involved in cell wall biosynthesis
MQSKPKNNTVNKAKRVLVVRNAFVYDFGGAERLAIHLARELRLNKIDAIIVSRQPRLLAYADAQGVPNFRAWWWSRQDWSGKKVLLFPIYFGWQLVLTVWYVQLIIRLKPDAVHLLSKDDFIAGTFAARLLGKRVIWSDPADLKHVFRNNRVWYKNPVGKLTYVASKLASTITLVSFSEKKLVGESLVHPLPPRFTVIHTAGRDETVVPVKRKEEDLDAVVFCSTSRLVIAKGIGELVESFSRLSKNSNKYRLWLVGDGPDKGLFEKQANGDPYIVFVGHTEQPLTYLAASDIYVHPTYHEGFSLSLAEGAMLGKPMIATNVGGNPELVNEGNGLLTTVKDVDSFYEAMLKLGENEDLRKRLGAQARKDYVNNFDFAHIVREKIMPLYEKT